MILKFLTEHESVPLWRIMWKGNKVYLINKFTGIKHKFLTGETELTMPAKEAAKIKEKYAELRDI